MIKEFHNKYFFIFLCIITVRLSAIPYETSFFPSNNYPWNAQFINRSTKPVQFMIYGPANEGKKRILNVDVLPGKLLRTVVTPNVDYTYEIFQVSLDPDRDHIRSSKVFSVDTGKSGLLSLTPEGQFITTSISLKKTKPRFLFDSTGKFETTDKATSTIAWNFELYNKRKETVIISVYNKDEGLRQVFGKPIHIGSYGKLRGIVDLKKIDIVQVKTNKGEVRNYTITPNAETNTVFVTIDENGMRPQTGQLLGLPDIVGEGKTDSNIPFFKKSNIMENQIKLLITK